MANSLESGAADLLGILPGAQFSHATPGAFAQIFWPFFFLGHGACRQAPVALTMVSRWRGQLIGTSGAADLLGILPGAQFYLFAFLRCYTFGIPSLFFGSHSWCPPRSLVVIPGPVTYHGGIVTIANCGFRRIQ